jgi:thymidylate kinase
MNRYIHFEGADLSGKTVVTRAFVDRRAEEWDVRSATLGAHNPLFDLANELCETGLYGSEVLGKAYAEALRADIDQYRPPEKDTVQESTILIRSLAYHAINRNRVVLGLLEEMAPLHPKFDDSFMLTVSHETRLRRLAARAKNTEHDLLIVRDPRKFHRIEASMADYSQELFGTRLIDTTEMTIAEVAAYIDSEINKKAKTTL